MAKREDKCLNSKMHMGYSQKHKLGYLVNTMKIKNVSNKLMLVLLVFTILLGISVGSLFIRTTNQQSEKYLKAITSEKKEELNRYLSEVGSSIDMLATQVASSLEDYTMLGDPEFEKEYTSKMTVFLKAALSNHSLGSYIFLRYNPEFADSCSGTYMQKIGENDYENVAITDLSKYTSENPEYVGWYYIPVKRGSAVWLETYHYAQLDAEMISYVVPIYADNGTLIGVIGKDVCIDELVKKVDEISLYDNGYAVLLDKSGNVLNSTNADIDDDSYEITEVKLDNEMRLRMIVPTREAYPMRYSPLLYMVIIAYFAMTVFIAYLFVIGNLKHSSRSSGSSVNGFMQKYALLIIVAVIVIVQIVYVVRSYYSNSKKYGCIEADNKYENTITVGGDICFDPFSFIDSAGKLSGYDIELINAVANDIGVNVSYRFGDWEDTIKAVEDGSIDVIMSINSEKLGTEDNILRSATSFEDSLSVYGKKAIQSVDELKNARIATIESISSRDIYGLTDYAEIFSTYEEEVDALEAGRFDYAVVRTSVADEIIRSRGYTDIIAVYDMSESNLCIGASYDNHELVSKINTSVEKLRGDGTLDKIYERWLGDDSYSSITGIVRLNRLFFEVTGMLEFLGLIGAFLSYKFYQKNKELKLERAQKNELQQISYKDQLTNLSNRRRLEAVLEGLRKETGIQMTVISMDLNGLKTTNDAHGHTAGDELLVGAADCIRETFSAYGECFRTGGDEFMAIIVGEKFDKTARVSDFESNMKKFRSEYNKELSISYGIASTEELGALSVDELCKMADRTMYANKSAFYMTKGNDRRGQRSAYSAICASYTKILKVDLSEDTFEIISMDENEKCENSGYAETISGWLYNFAAAGQIHDDDVLMYLAKTEIGHLRSFFAEGNTSFAIHYRRRFGDEFKKVMLEMVPAPEYTQLHQKVYLYVKVIGE